MTSNLQIKDSKIIDFLSELEDRLIKLLVRHKIEYNVAMQKGVYEQIINKLIERRIAGIDYKKAPTGLTRGERFYFDMRAC